MPKEKIEKFEEEALVIQEPKKKVPMTDVEYSMYLSSKIREKRKLVDNARLHRKIKKLKNSLRRTNS